MILRYRILGRRIRTALARISPTALVVVLAVLCAAVITGENIHDRAVSNCQAEYNNAFAQSITEHSDLAQQDRDATSMLISAVFTVTPGATQAQRVQEITAAYARYKASENRIDATRRAHPYPTLPSRAC